MLNLTNVLYLLNREETIIFKFFPNEFHLGFCHLSTDLKIVISRSKLTEKLGPSFNIGLSKINPTYPQGWGERLIWRIHESNTNLILYISYQSITGTFEFLQLKYAHCTRYMPTPPRLRSTVASPPPPHPTRTQTISNMASTFSPFDSKAYFIRTHLDFVDQIGRWID